MKPISPLLRPALLAAALLVLSSSVVLATPGDTTWVRTFDHDFYNWATAHEQTFTFPDTTIPYSKVILNYRIECPASPGDCDPWDRLGYLRLLRDTEYIELARVVTPYDITPPPRPEHCTWTLDVSDYEFLLHGQVTLNNYIETWIGGSRGWIVTIDFGFIEGQPQLRPFALTNLWGNYYAEYGNPNNPIENVLALMNVPIPPDADVTKFRAIVTGHGQGNTSNCAEFCNRVHTIVANGASFSHNLWRTDCNTNPCSPQGGTWTYARAGWCPGSAVYPWDVDLTGQVTPGTNADLDYNVQAYTNFCRPDNPDCVNGQTCPDCNYNSNGHTVPIYAVQSQVIFYHVNPLSDAQAVPSGRPRSNRLTLEESSPNPFVPPTTIRFSLGQTGPCEIRIHDAGGRIVRSIRLGSLPPGQHAVQWDGEDDAGRGVAAGVYFYEVRSGEEAGVKRMMLLR